MIELLKNNRIDSPLLCELASHPDFVKLLADVKIYVEGIATMQIHNDIDTITKNLRKSHLGKSDSPPKTSITEKLKQTMKEALNFKGSRTEQLLFYCVNKPKLKRAARKQLSLIL